MATKPLEATVRQEGHAAIISLRGEIDSFGEETLNKAYDAAEAMGTGAVLLNFSAVEYMNSTGIGLLVTLLIRVNRQKQRLLAYGLSEHYRQILDLTRLDEAIGIYSGEVDALTAAGTV